MKKTKERKGEITDEELEDALQGDIPDEFACALSFCVRYSFLACIMNYLTLAIFEAPKRSSQAAFIWTACGEAYDKKGTLGQ